MAKKAISVFCGCNHSIKKNEMNYIVFNKTVDWILESDIIDNKKLMDFAKSFGIINHAIVNHYFN